MASSIDRLVDDVLIQILQALTVRAVLAVRKTSRRYYLLTKLRCIWYARFCTDVLARNLPAPGPLRPLSLLSAMELEHRTLRALYLHQTWPRLSAHTLVSHAGGAAPVDQVMFMPGGTELLTVQGDTVMHWLIVSWAGLAQGLKHLGAWTPAAGVPCRVVKDEEMPGLFAVGPREPLGSHRFAKVFSTSLRAPFVTLCDYARVPGVVVGVWRQLLLLDTTREPGGGGLELLDWRAQTTGTALLPCLPDLFGRYLDCVVFAGHLLVVWEHCMSVFPVPRVPTDGQVVLEHKRVFIFEEAVCRPVGFTTCVTRHVEVPCVDPSGDVDQVASCDMGWHWEGRCEQCPTSAVGMLPTLTIAAQSKRQARGMSMMMLIPLADERDHEKEAVGDANGFPYRLAYPPARSPVMGRPEQEGEGDSTCTAICLGSSGRGICVVGRELRLVSPELYVLPPFEMQFGPMFETGEALYLVDKHLRRNVNLDGTADMVAQGDAEGADASGDKVDFDEGMGRFVVVTACGGFEIVQLD